jgi:SAM-dependent methyltransferase
MEMLDKIAVKSIAKGLLSFIPGWQWIRRKEGGGASSSRYCYAVWLRHRVLTARHGFISHPHTVAELGPGDSIGTGLAALLSGCQVYLAFDIVPFTSLESNVRVLDELVELFQRRASIPDDAEFPALYPRLDHYAFPEDLFPGDHLEKALGEERIRAIREALLKTNGDSGHLVHIRYVAPWNSNSLVEADSVDMIFSQAVMEHVDDLQSAYKRMHQWLKPGGILSHEIDFKCHGTSKHWNGHWTYPEPIWRIIKGRRPYFLNRLTCGHQLDFLRRAGFEIEYISRQEKAHFIHREDLCKSLAHIPDDDLCTSSAHIIARKRDIHHGTG